jgi:hypothetical protein
MNRISINGRIFQGNSIVIRGDTITVDGRRQDGTVSGVVEVRVIEGVVERLETDASVTCGEVRGSVSAGGSVQVSGDVGGSVKAGGSVEAGGKLEGTSVNAGGSVRIGS